LVFGDDSDQVNLQNLDWILTATVADDYTDTDTLTVTGADPSDATLTVTDHGQDQVYAHLISPDGISGTITATDTLTDNPTDIDHFQDGESVTDTYSVHLTGNGDTTTATVTATVTDTQTGSDDETSTWDSADDSGTEHDNRTDGLIATVRLINGVYALDSAG